MKEKKTKSQVLKEIFIGYFKSMLFAFTGGNMTLPLIQEELSVKYDLIEKEKVLEYYAIAQAIPGAISLNSGLMVGRHIAGWPGGLVAAAAIILPAFFGMLLITVLYEFLERLTFINNAIDGIRVASVAIILANAVEIIQIAKTKFHFILVILSSIAIIFFKINVVLVIISTGVIGIGEYIFRIKKVGDK